MTRIFKMTVVAGMLVGLIVAPLGLAQADQHAGGANGASFDLVIPTFTAPKQDAKAPSLTVTLNGQQHTIGGQEVSAGGDTVGGGVLTVIFEASDWLVEYTQIVCPAGQIGTGVVMSAKSPAATLEAIYKAFSGETRELAAPPVNNRYPSGNFGLCA